MTHFYSVTYFSRILSACTLSNQLRNCDDQINVDYVFFVNSNREAPPSPTHRKNKFIVYESCIMELFQSCPLCTRPCDVSTHRLGTFLSVKQHCLHCLHTRHWNSQPVLGSTPAGNLQLSAAVYVSGASFIQIEKVNNVQQCCTRIAV